MIFEYQMKKILLVFFTVIMTVSGFAQKTADIGLWGGSSTYFGDLQESNPMQSFNLNVGGYFRYNFNARIGLRGMFLTGNFAADGYYEGTPFEFSKSAQDITGMIEINFLRYVLGDRKTPFTPYIMGGFGVMYYSYDITEEIQSLYAINPMHPNFNVTDEAGNPIVIDKESVISGSVPFGFGVKFSLTRRLGMGIEYQMRKLLTDKFDNLDDPLAYTSAGGETVRYRTILHNNDWPGYLGVHLLYKINLNPQACPAYDRKNW